MFNYQRQFIPIVITVAISLLTNISYLEATPTNIEQTSATKSTKAEDLTPKFDYSRYGGTLTVAIAPVKTLDSQLATDFSSKLLIHNIQEGLFQFNNKQELVYILANAAPQMEDELNYLLYLREGIYFHDGTEFDANSVVYTVERLLNPSTKAPLQSYFARQIKSAQVIDKHTVRVKLSQSYVDVAALFSRTELYPLSAKTVDKYGTAYGKVVAVGTGPFTFFEWKQEENLILKRFNSYWKPESTPPKKIVPETDITLEDEFFSPEELAGQEKIEPEAEAIKPPNLPYLNILQFRFHASEELALVDLQTRRLSALGGINATTAKQINSRSRYIRTLHQPGLLLEQIYLNTEKHPFNNKLVRMALAYGLDKELIALEVFGEYATPAQSLFPPWHWARNPEYQGLGYHPQIAKQLIKQAGYTETNPLRFELLCTAEDKFIGQANLVVKQWQELGVQAKLTPVSKEELMGRIYGKDGWTRDFSAALEDWKGGINPDLFAYDLYSPASPYNKVAYKNPLIDLLFYDARSSQRREEQVIFYQEAEKLITSDVSTIYLSFPHNIWAYNRYVEGLKQDYRGLISFSRVWFHH